MPLKKARKGASKAQRQRVASKNIGEMRAHGYSRKVAIAAGLRAAGLAKKRKRKN